jgi:putative ABC transport system permease protein
LSFIWRMAGRELSRQGWRLALIALCISVGFAAFFATYGFSGKVLASIRAESRSLLGADLALSSRGPMPPQALLRLEAEPRLQARTLLYDFPSMASTGQGETAASRLVEVRAVEGAYPLAGRLETQPPRDGREPWGVLVEAGLAQAWGLSAAAPGLGEAELLAQRRGLRLGSEVVPVQAIVGQDDSRQASAFALGPRVYLGLATARRLGLVTPRARLSGRLLMTLKPGADLKATARDLQAGLPKAERLRLQTHEEAGPALSQPIRNTNRFISQLGLFTLMLSSLGAWAILATYLQGREKDAAILRCLGAPPGAPAAIFAILTALMVGAALVLGGLAGTFAARALPALLGDLMPQALRQGPMPWPPLPETFAAVLMLVLVTLPFLARLRDVSPLALLREGAAGPSRRALGWLCGLGGAALACLLVFRNAPSPAAGAVIAGAFAFLFLALYGVSRLLLRIFRHTAERLPLALKLALGQLSARPSLGALLMSVIGLSVFLVLATQFVKEDLVRPLAAQRGAGKRPNLFFIDVQPDQIEPLRTLLRERAGREPLASPMVRARLTAVAGRPVEEEPAGTEGPQRGQSMRTREQNLTWRTRLSDSESLVAGTYWPEAGPPRAELSLEEGFARQIGARLGDTLAFDVQGEALEGKVTSLRRVSWQSFQPNFFIVTHPSLLRDQPATWIAAAELDDAGARVRLQNEVAQRFPNLTTMDIGEVVARIGRVLDLVALVTRALAALMLTSALLVLAASLLAARLGRQRDLALLRTLGASHRTLLASLAWEFLLLGGVAALGSGLLAWILARAYSSRVLELEGHPDPWAAVLLILLAALLTAAVGLLGSFRALQAKPMDVLRGE